MAQWLRIHLPMQGTGFEPWSGKIPHATEQLSPCATTTELCAVEPASHNYGAHVPQLLNPTCLEPVLCNKRSHRNERPAHCNKV